MKKKHPQVKGHCELQSSNSSDALLMSIFAHPDLPKWKGMGNLLGTGRINNIDFGVKYKLKKSNNKEKKATEFDMVINNCYIFESKLTEKDFTNKNHKEVEKYDYFDNTFYKSFLKQTKRGYENYQIIRNILALQERFNRFVLLCDERRPDLIIRFYETVKCIRDISIRNKCKVITWQQVAFVCRKNLKKFLEQKYGING
ncbi:MAG: hypothetical protein FJ216_07150 [Ignavibacteria bacterium]|nr:hypothetical protein [Ignavibacteria bacterium]